MRKVLKIIIPYNNKQMKIKYKKNKLCIKKNKQ